MIMLFTDKEKEWLETKPFDWGVKKGCPEDIEKAIKKKLAAINKHAEKLK